jgi:sulfide dehydrogenase cytochrome subunit
MRTTVLLLAALAAPAFAQDTATRALAATCANCHGTDGRSATKEVPALAGLPKEHIASQMKAFKEGTRPATVMHQLAKGYTDPQIEALAAYFAAQK